MELQVEHLITFLIAITPTLGLLFKYIQNNANLAKWRGVVEERLKQAEEDRKVIHERIGSKESEVEKKVDLIMEAISDLQKEVAVLLDRQDRNG